VRQDRGGVVRVSREVPGVGAGAVIKNGNYSAASIRFFRFGVARPSTGERNCPV
jgi:hypothetical protein